MFIGFHPSFWWFQYYNYNLVVSVVKATWPREVRSLASEFLKRPIHVQTGAVHEMTVPWGGWREPSQENMVKPMKSLQFVGKTMEKHETPVIGGRVILFPWHETHEVKPEGNTNKKNEISSVNNFRGDHPVAKREVSAAMFLYWIFFLEGMRG